MRDLRLGPARIQSNPFGLIRSTRLTSLALLSNVDGKPWRCAIAFSQSAAEMFIIFIYFRICVRGLSIILYANHQNDDALNPARRRQTLLRFLLRAFFCLSSHLRGERAAERTCERPQNTKCVCFCFPSRVSCRRTRDHHSDRHRTAITLPHIMRRSARRDCPVRAARTENPLQFQLLLFRRPVRDPFSARQTMLLRLRVRISFCFY